jgi:glycerophosphoryl diester phosphodiesterase
MNAHTLNRLRRRDDRVLLHGHRGARGAFPENTMPGFDYLASIGIQAVEFDVLCAAGGVPVLTHNPYLLADTTRDGKGDWLDGQGPKLIETPWAALREYDVGAIRAGSAYHARFPEQARLSGVQIPSLERFCAWAQARPAMFLDIEIKSFANAPDLTPPPGELLAAVLDPVHRYGLADRVLVQSFDWRVLSACKAQAPDILRGYLARLDRPGADTEATVYPGSPWLDGLEAAARDGGMPDALAQVGAHVWCPHVTDLAQADLERAQALGLAVHVWTVNDADEIARVARMGVDGIITDLPARAQNVLAGMGLGWRFE